jgi:Cd2+/Zn2+-exporting ATPase
MGWRHAHRRFLCADTCVATGGPPARAIIILIVFCPCVMVLATPTALVASIGNAALRGSLVKKGATVEALAGIDTVAFDKTGTLTFGAPRLVETRPLNGMAEGELLQLAAVAEKYSEHPLGQSVVRAARVRGLAVADPDDFEPLPGLGVRAGIDGREVVLGRVTCWRSVGWPSLRTWRRSS